MFKSEWMSIYEDILFELWFQCIHQFHGNWLLVFVCLVLTFFLHEHDGWILNVESISSDWIDNFVQRCRCRLTILFLTLTGSGLQCRFAKGSSFWQLLKMMSRWHPYCSTTHGWYDNSSLYMHAISTCKCRYQFFSPKTLTLIPTAFTNLALLFN